jgi:GNAT superfamily N-acetyltransferase
MDFDELSTNWRPKVLYLKTFKTWVQSMNRSKRLARRLFRQANQLLVDYHVWHTNHAYGQDDYVIYATLGVEKIVVGKLLFSIFENEIYVNYVEVDPDYRRQGIGKGLLNRLRQGFPDMNIHPGYTSEEGSSLYQSWQQDLGREKSEPE